ncbi:glycosyltransferase family 4 protein [Arvimicrobium flavum]|uniref:glycosyltransferase family 4 protein n=1 Tax=Arvimicrobium flavum TaxID=3393320 RepID=UPI00237BBAD7|nr:glycosyltransferase family 4 protein [Mesorhizobium shangrilense]
MHLVFATSLVPDGAMTSGYEIATAAIVDALRRAGVRVTVVGFKLPGREAIDPDQTVVLGTLEVRTDRADTRTKLRWLGKAMLSNMTFSSAKLLAIPPAALKKELARLEPFDGFLLNSVQFAAAYEECFVHKPSLFAPYNVEYRSAAENAEAAHSAVERFLYRREARLLETVEKRLCDRASFVYTLAPEDRAPLGVASDARSAWLPLVARLTPPQRVTRRDIACDAALIGTWTWHPNLIGLEWFLNEVVPHLPSDFRVNIAGSVPTRIRSDHPGVRLVGRVPDATEFVLSGAAVPLISRAGTGVQLKTIETFELGLPSVATRSSLRGITNVPENCAVTDDAREFARLLVETSKKPDCIDGSRFYAAQRAALDATIRRGLETLKAGRLEAAA